MSINKEQKTVEENNEASVRKVNLVVVEDADYLADQWGDMARKAGKEVDVYYDRNEFLANRNKYVKDTKMIINYGYNKKPNGVQVAKILFEEGYTKLYLTTGLDPKGLLDEEGRIPSYLTVLFKMEGDGIPKALME